VYKFHRLRYLIHYKR